MRCEIPGLNPELRFKLYGLSTVEGSGISGVAVKCVEIGRNTSGEGATWTDTDAEARKRGEQTGLDTLVVHAVNDENWMLAGMTCWYRS